MSRPIAVVVLGLLALGAAAPAAEADRGSHRGEPSAVGNRRQRMVQRVLHSRLARAAIDGVKIGKARVGLAPAAVGDGSIAIGLVARAVGEPHVGPPAAGATRSRPPLAIGLAVSAKGRATAVGGAVDVEGRGARGYGVGGIESRGGLIRLTGDLPFVVASDTAPGATARRAYRKARWAKDR